MLQTIMAAALAAAAAHPAPEGPAAADQATATQSAATQAADPAAQESTDHQFVSISADEGPWYLQRASCTLAHNATDHAEIESERGILVVWFRIGLFAGIEFRDRRLRGVQTGAEATLAVTVDGAPQPVHGAWGLVYPIKSSGYPMRGGGYRLLGSRRMLDAIAAGRRLEIERDGQPLVQLDLTGAGPAIAALRACHVDRGA